MAIPPYTVAATSDAWAFIKMQSQDILHPTHLDAYIRREAMVMRWMLPAVYWVTDSIVGVLVVQALLGCTFLYLFLREVYHQTSDPVLTVFFGLALSNMFIVSWFFVDTAGYGDGYALFFLMLALLSRQPLLVFLFLQAAFFVDERAVVAVAYVVIWWTTQEVLKRNEKDSLVSVARSVFTVRTWTAIAAFVAYYVFRRYIMATYFSDHSYSAVGTLVGLSDEHRWGQGSSLWTSFEGAWLLLGAAALVLYQIGRSWLLALTVVGFAILLITGLLVHDINRALAYGFPFLLTGSLILTKIIPLAEYRKLVFVMAIVCIISPMCYTLGFNKIVWAEPLPIKVMMAVDRVVGWGLFD